MTKVLQSAPNVAPCIRSTMTCWNVHFMGVWKLGMVVSATRCQMAFYKCLQHVLLQIFNSTAYFYQLSGRYVLCLVRSAHVSQLLVTAVHPRLMSTFIPAPVDLIKQFLKVKRASFHYYRPFFKAKFCVSNQKTFSCFRSASRISHCC